MTHIRVEENDKLFLIDNKIHACVGSEEYIYSLEQVVRIVILTTDVGPFYDDMGLAIDVGNDTAIFIMSEHECYQEFLFNQIGKVLPIDYEMIIQAAACIEKNIFEIYKKE